MRNLRCAILLFLLCAPLFAQRIDNITHAADFVELPAATLDELARTSVVMPLGGHDERTRPRFVPQRAHVNAIVADFVSAPEAAPAPPPVTRGFRSSFDPLPGATIAYDPADAAGAVGPHHVVGAFNNSLVVHDRNGNQLSFLSIYQFWQGVSSGDTSIYDPRIVYDAVNDRWVLAMLADTYGSLGALLLATTTTGDPTGTWRRFRVAAGSNSDFSLDFTRLALTSDQIVVTANLFDSVTSRGLDIFMFPKNVAFSSDPASFSVTRAFVSGAFDFTPVTTSDTTIRLLTQDDASIVQYIFDTTTLTYVNEYLPPVGFALGDGECSQLGSTKSVDCDGSSLHYALFRNGSLWVVHSANDGSRGFVVVWRIAGSTAKGFVLRDAVTNYAYPSVAVNRFGAALIGFSTFNGSIYPSAAYRYIDPAGNVSDAGVVKDGESWYGFSRWGDYSSTVVDPADDTSFWTLQSYATPPYGTSHSTWGTWWSYVQVKAPRMRAVRH